MNTENKNFYIALPEIIWLLMYLLCNQYQSPVLIYWTLDYVNPIALISPFSYSLCFLKHVDLDSFNLASLAVGVLRFFFTNSYFIIHF